MFVTISGTPYFAYTTWNYWKAYTWVDVIMKTWGEVLGPNSSKIMMTSTPSVRDIVEDRSTADFSILDLTHAYSFQKGQYVSILSSDLETIFTGYIDTVTQRRVSPDGVIEHQISCVDNHYLADKRLIAKAFVAPDTIGTAVAWIQANILAAEGVAVGSIQSTVPIEGISYDYIPVSQALDDLANYAGNTWYISADKLLYFVPRTVYPAAFNLTEVAGVWTDVMVDNFAITSTNPEYRNQQYIKGGSTQTDLQTEIQKGDGVTTSFVVGYGIAATPVIQTNIGGAGYGANKTIGIKGVDTGKQWYWSSGDPIVIQDPSEPRLTSADLVRVQYYGLYSIVLSSADFDAIIDRQAVEYNTSGLVDGIRDDPLVTTQNAGLDEANSLLDHYATIGTKVEYTTRQHGLEAGTLQHITSTIHGIDDDFLITNIEKVPIFVNDSQLANAEIHYNVTAMAGPVEDYWTKVFLKMNKSASAVGSVSSATSVVLVLRPFAKTWVKGVTTPDIWATSIDNGTYLVNNALVPCYEPGDEVKYVAFYLSGVEVYRKYRTAQTWTASKITTIFIIPSGEANTTWDTIKFFGGSLASASSGSGSVTYSTADPYTKNSLEALQIVFTATSY